MISRALRHALLILLSLVLPLQALGAEEQIQQFLQTQLQKHLRRTPGASLCVLREGLPPLTVVAGKTRPGRKGRRIRESDTFRLASMTKTYVATLTLLLQEEGLLSLSERARDAIGPHIRLENFPNGKTVTLQQLLQMRSGIPDYLESSGFESRFEEEPTRRWSAGAALKLLYGAKPLFRPGQRYHYSNSNYLLLQAVMELRNQKSLRSLMRQKLLDPHGLNETFIEFERSARRLTTRGHEMSDEKTLLDVTRDNDGLGLADGGMIATACDVARFVKALLHERAILSAESLSKMLNFDPRSHYGLGIERETTTWGEAWTHNGTSSGFQGQYFYFPSSGLTWVLLTNNLDSETIEPFFEESLPLLSRNFD